MTDSVDVPIENTVDFLVINKNFRDRLPTEVCRHRHFQKRHQGCLHGGVSNSFLVSFGTRWSSIA